MDLKFFGTTYVGRKDEKVLYRGKDAAQAERIAAGNAQHGAALAFEKRSNKEALHKEYTRADWDRTHRHGGAPTEPVHGVHERRG
jgi:hypothetical protein